MKHLHSASQNKKTGLAAGLLILFLAAGIQVQSQTDVAVWCGVCDLAWSPVDNNLLAAVNKFGLWLYDASKRDSTPVLFSFPNATSLDFSPDGNTIAITTCAPLNRND